jgi:uncharacterized protein YceH (UPF0502 family)
MLDVSPVEIRIVGALIEKQRTTPDGYPLTLNALRAACNQSTSRDPVVEYDDATLREGLERLGRRGWTRLASGPGSRAPKYRHLIDEALGLDGPAMSVLAVLLLRGPQTGAELQARTERLYPFGSRADVEAVLERLAERRLVRLNERRPGEREARWQHLIGGAASAPAAPAAAAPPGQAPAAAPPPAPAAAASAAADGSLAERVAALEAEVAELRARLDELDGGA